MKKGMWKAILAIAQADDSVDESGLSLLHVAATDTRKQFTVAEAARILGKTRQTVNNYSKTGAVGKNGRFISRDDLNAILRAKPRSLK